MPTRQQLDAVCSDIPIYFADDEAHKGLANSILLVKAGIMKEDGTPLKREIRGSVIQIGSDGTPTGFLKEQEGTYTRSFLDNENLFSVDIASANMAEIEKLLLSEGYTMYQDGWSSYFYNSSLYQAAQQRDQAGDMHFVLGLSYEIESWMDVDEAMAKASDVKTLYGRYGGKRHRICRAIVSRRASGQRKLVGRGSNRHHAQGKRKGPDHAHTCHGQQGRQSRCQCLHQWWKG